MDDFDWGQENFGVATPHALQDNGVNAYFAPNIPPDTKVVDLAGGRVARFRDGEPRPQQGYYADFASLQRYARQTGTPLVETNGQISTEPATTGEAGNPLLHRGH